MADMFLVTKFRIKKAEDCRLESVVELAYNHVEALHQR